VFNSPATETFARHQRASVLQPHGVGDSQVSKDFRSWSSALFQEEPDQSLGLVALSVAQELDSYADAGREADDHGDKARRCTVC